MDSMQKLKLIAFNVKERLFHIFLSLVLTFIGLAFLTQVTFVILEFSGQEETLRNIVNQISWRFDGTFKNSPESIWYNEDEHIWVESVSNQVKIGKLAGNRNLEFGVKNILEEYLQEKEFELSPDAPNKLKVEIEYLSFV